MQFLVGAVRSPPFRVAIQNMQLQGVVVKIDAQGRRQEIHRVQLHLKSA
jgi:calcineurin-like phosphoesterase